MPRRDFLIRGTMPDESGRMLLCYEIVWTGRLHLRLGRMGISKEILVHPLVGTFIDLLQTLYKDAVAFPL